MSKKQYALAFIAACLCLSLIYYWSEHFRSEQPADPLAQPQLFTPVELSDYPKTSLGKEVLRFRYVTIRPEVIEQLRRTSLSESAQFPKNLSITLFDDVAVTLVIAEKQNVAQSDGNDVIVLSGGVEGEKYAIATLSFMDDSLFAKIGMPGREFRIVPTKPPMHRIDEIRPIAESETVIFE